MGMPTVEEIIDIRDESPTSIPDGANTSGAIKLTAGRHDHSKKEPKPEEKKAGEDKPKEAPKPADALKLEVVDPKSNGREDLARASTKMLLMLAGRDEGNARGLLGEFCINAGLKRTESFKDLDDPDALLVYTLIVEEVKRLAKE